VWKLVASAVLTAGVASAAFLNAQDVRPVQWAITGATLIDGTGAAAVPQSVVVGREQQITCAGTLESCTIPEGAVITNAAGKWIIPGLIDTHIHPNWSARKELTREDQLRRFAFGTTTTRDAGTPDTFEENLDARESAKAAASPEPRLVVSGLLSPTNLTRYGDGDFSTAVRKMVELGADAIKIKEKYNADELNAIVGEAHAAGVPVFGHTSSGTDPQSHLEPALEAGVDGLSHVATIAAFSRRTGIDRGPVPGGVDQWVWVQQLWDYVDDAKVEVAIDRIIQHGTWLEPTLITDVHFTLPYPLSDDLAYLGSPPTLKEVVRPWIPWGEQSVFARRSRNASITRAFEIICKVVQRFHARGGILVTGTDGEQPGASLIDEIRLLTQCGLTPLEALQAATQNAAAILKRPDLGTVQAGKLADLVILDADPLGDMTNLRRVWRVVKGGQLHDPNVLLRPTVDSYEGQVRKTWILACALFLAALVALVSVRVLRNRRRQRR
jgi:imidazolonepropionase-like amidohydrolase